MDLENKIKNHLKNASSLEGVDVNDLWSNIEKGLEDKKAEQQLILFKKHHLLGGLIFLFITGGISWSLFFSNFKAVEKYPSTTYEAKNTTKAKSLSINKKTALIDKKVVTKDQAIIHNISKDKKPHQNTNFDHKIASIDTKNSLARKGQPIIHNANKSKPSYGKTSSNNKIAPIDIKNSLAAKKQSTTHLIIKDKQLHQNTYSDHKIALTNINHLPLTKDQPITRSINKDKQSHQNTYANNKVSLTNKSRSNKYTTISNKKIKTLNIRDLAIQQPLNLEHKPIDRDKDLFSLDNVGKKTKFSVGTFLGLHTTKNIFFTPSNSDNISDLLNKGYQYELGGSIGLEVDFRFYKNLFVLTGFEYNQSMSEFNVTQSWGITRVNPISPTGYSNATATRVVKHHNKMSYYAIPLFLGIKKSIGRLEYGISLGVHLNFTQSQTGKTLNQYDNIVTLDSGTTPLPVSKFFISYSCRPFINYQINKNITIQLRVDGRYQNYGFSDLYHLNHAAIYMGLSIGAQFKF